MTLVVVPSGIGGQWQTDVGSFAQGVLGGIGATHTDVELVATVATADDHGAANKASERYQHLPAELLQNRSLTK